MPVELLDPEVPPVPDVLFDPEVPPAPVVLFELDDPEVPPAPDVLLELLEPFEVEELLKFEPALPPAWNPFCAEFWAEDALPKRNRT